MDDAQMQELLDRIDRLEWQRSGASIRLRREVLSGNLTAGVAAIASLLNWAGEPWLWWYFLIPLVVVPLVTALWNRDVVFQETPRKHYS